MAFHDSIPHGLAVEGLGQVTTLKVVDGYGSENNDKQALKSATDELGLVLSSKDGFYACRGLRAAFKVYEFKTQQVSIKNLTLAIRLYINGKMYDIPRDITSIISKDYPLVAIPPYRYNGRSKYVRLADRVTTDGKSELVSALERMSRDVGDKRVRYRAFEVDSVAVALYLISVYNKEVEYDKDVYIKLKQTSDKVDSNFSLAFVALRNKGFELLENVKFKEPDTLEGVDGDNIVISESHDITTLPLVEKQASDNIVISEYHEITNSESGVDMELLFKLVKETNDMVKTIIQVLPSLATLPEIKAILNHKPQIREVVVQADSKLKNRTLDIESEGCNEFMVAVVNRYNVYRGKGLSMLKSAEAVVNEIETNPVLSKYHLPFIVANRGKKNGSSDEIKAMLLGQVSDNLFVKEYIVFAPFNIGKDTATEKDACR